MNVNELVTIHSRAGNFLAGSSHPQSWGKGLSRHWDIPEAVRLLPVHTRARLITMTQNNRGFLPLDDTKNSL